LGGEGAVWTEYIDAHNVECRTWPRAGIIASKIWGDIIHNRIKITVRDFTDDIRRDDAEDIPVSVFKLSKSLHMSYIRFTYYLKQKGLEASAISLNLSVMSTNGKAQYIPVQHWKENKLLRHWLNDTNSYVSDVSGQLLQVTDKLLSQCPDIPESTQRPVWNSNGSDSRSDVPVMSSMFLNVAEGARERKKRSQLQQWLTEQANLGVSFIGMSELNGWDQLESPSEYKYNYPRIRRLASEVGYSYSHVMTSSQPYNIGIVSAVPFEVLGEYYPPSFQRGLLHVFMKSLGLHVFVVHLHAHSSHMREIESAKLAAMIHPIIEQNEMKVLVMGDFNSLHLKDKEGHDVWTDIFVNSAATSPIITRLKKKFCHENSSEINYVPMQILTDIGLRDSCEANCVAMHEGEDIRRQCYVSNCSYSQPTSFNPEVFN
jgi:hypothetical protein